MSLLNLSISNNSTCIHAFMCTYWTILKIDRPKYTTGVPVCLSSYFMCMCIQVRIGESNQFKYKVNRLYVYTFIYEQDHPKDRQA